MQKRKQQIFAVVIITLGLCILNYPTVIRTINYFFAYQDIVEYEEQVSNENAEKNSHDLELISIYNRGLLGTTPYDPFSEKVPSPAKEYQDIEFLRENANLGYIKIPSIGLMTPVHYGTTNRVLDENLGMLVGSSLPTSGLGVHSVISGHTGMVTRKLFSDLHRVKINDLFFIYTNSQKLAYRVDQIKVVKPDENEDLYINPLQNYVTLITCTPIGINDHRLLVRGTLIDYDFSQDEMVDFYSGISIWDIINIVFLFLSMIVIAIIIIYVVRNNRKDQQPKDKKPKDKQPKDKQLDDIEEVTPGLSIKPKHKLFRRKSVIKTKAKNRILIPLVAIAAITVSFLTSFPSYATGTNDLHLKGLKAKDNAAVTVTEVSLYHFATPNDEQSYDIDSTYNDLGITIADLIYAYDRSTTTIGNFIKQRDITTDATAVFNTDGDASFLGIADGIYVILQTNPASSYDSLMSAITIPPAVIQIPGNAVAQSEDENVQVISYIKYTVQETEPEPEPEPEPTPEPKKLPNTPLTVDNVVRWITILICCVLGITYVIKLKQ